MHRRRPGHRRDLRAAELRSTGCAPKGTRKLVERYGERLVRVRYLYDAKACRQYKTVELIVSSTAWQPHRRNPRRRDDDIIAVRIAYEETELRERAKRLGAVWPPVQKIWEIAWGDAKRLGVANRVISA